MAEIDPSLLHTTASRASASIAAPTGSTRTLTTTGHLPRSRTLFAHEDILVPSRGRIMGSLDRPPSRVSRCRASTQ